MSVVTDTTNHESGNSRGDSRIAPTEDWTRVIFGGIPHVGSTGTTKHEKDDGLSVAARLIAGAGNWIPAFAGMTIAASFGLFSEQ